MNPITPNHRRAWLARAKTPMPMRSGRQAEPATWIQGQRLLVTNGTAIARVQVDQIAAGKGGYWGYQGYNLYRGSVHCSTAPQIGLLPRSPGASGLRPLQTANES